MNILLGNVNKPRDNSILYQYAGSIGDGSERPSVFCLSQSSLSINDERPDYQRISSNHI